MPKNDLRRNGRSGLDTVNVTDPNAQVVEEAIYGSLGELDTGRMVAKPISIDDISPDPKQPRRQIPSVVRQRWDGQSIGSLFNTWANGFAHESERQINEIEAIIDQVLEGEEVSPVEVYQGEYSDPKRTWGVIGGSLMAVANLAAEIRRDGLTNPITIARVDGHYLIETGERRWLAFQLLNLFYPDSAAWKRIPAREVTASSVWRQASENTARTQLNAISMARQLAILLMDLYGSENFMSFDEAVLPGASDRSYYAQVADGNQWRVPSGKGEQLVSAMGIPSPDMLRKYRNLLRLPDEVWMLADDLNWEEGFIRRQIVERAANESGMISLAQFEADGAGYRVTDSSYTVTRVTVSDDEIEDTREEWQLEDQEVPESDQSEGQETPEIADRPDNEAELALGGRGAAVRAPSGQNGILVMVVGRIAHVDTANGVRQYDVNKLTHVVNGDEAEPAEDDSAQDEIEPIAEFQLKILRASYKQATLGLLWFSAASIGTAPETLNRMADQGLLETKAPGVNSNYQTGHYRITPQGCAAINLPVFIFKESAPRSGSNVHSSTTTSTPSAGTPPVTNNPDPDAEQKETAKRIFKTMESALEQYKFSVEKLPVDKITLPALQAEFDVHVKKMMDFLYATRLRVKKQ